MLKLLNVSLYEASFVWSMPFNNDFLDPSSQSNRDEDNLVNIDGFIIFYRVLDRNVGKFDPNFDSETMFEESSLQQDDLQQRNRFYKPNNWETISVSDKHQGHTLRNLRCGTLYQIRLEAFNEMGSGESSDVLQFSTLGQGELILGDGTDHNSYLYQNHLNFECEKVSNIEKKTKNNFHKMNSR